MFLPLPPPWSLAIPKKRGENIAGIIIHETQLLRQVAAHYCVSSLYLGSASKLSISDGLDFLYCFVPVNEATHVVSRQTNPFLTHGLKKKITIFSARKKGVCCVTGVDWPERNCAFTIGVRIHLTNLLCLSTHVHLRSSVLSYITDQKYIEAYFAKKNQRTQWIYLIE